MTHLKSKTFQETMIEDSPSHLNAFYVLSCINKLNIIKKTEYTVMAITFYGSDPGLRFIYWLLFKIEEQYFRYIYKTCIQVMWYFGKDRLIQVYIGKG